METVDEQPFAFHSIAGYEMPGQGDAVDGTVETARDLNEDDGEGDGDAGTVQ